MMELAMLAAAFVFGGGLGYAIGWNHAAHPGKIQAQVDAALAKAKSDV